MQTVTSITVCGGGNAAHVAVPLLVRQGYRVTLYTPFAAEAERFREGVAAGGLEAAFPDGQVVRGSPALVTREPQEAADSDLILMVVPAFAHGPLLQALAPHLPAQAFVGAIPSRGGFELEALHHLRGRPGPYTIFCGHTLPWACRVEKYGRRVKVLGVKESVGLAALPAERAPLLAKILGGALGAGFTAVANSLAVSLGNMGQVIHPGIMYGLLRDYRGAVWREAEIPLFYQGVTAETAAILEDLSAEIMSVAARLSRDFAIDLSAVLSVGQWLIRSYARYIADSSSLSRSFRTNRSYRGLKLPVKKVAGGFVPDFQSRYLTEDVPYGLLFSKAVAVLANCATPRMDEVITAAGRWMNKEYLDRRGGLTGPDLKEARIPQNYGIGSGEELVGVVGGQT